MQKINSTTFSKHAKLLKGFDQMIDKKLIQIKGNVMQIYPELWSNNPEAFTANAYRYFRLKIGLPENSRIEIHNIETGKLLAHFANNNASVIAGT